MNTNYSSFIDIYIEEPKFKDLERYLLKNFLISDKGINIPLSDSFANHFNDTTITADKWTLLCDWALINYNHAPTNSPKEFLTFCAVKAFGEFYAYGSVKEQRYILTILKSSMNDRRWKIREASVMALQRIGVNNFFSLKKIINKFYPTSNLLEKRAFIAALAYPELLKKESNILFSLELSENILQDILNLTPLQLKSVSFKILSKTLEYALSIFVAYRPKEGFKMLKKFATVGEEENDIRRIIKSNLGKVRLYKPFGDEVTEVYSLMKE